MTVLSRRRQRLLDLEQQITNGFMIVSAALAEIKRDALYRPDYPSFHAYVEAFKQRGPDDPLRRIGPNYAYKHAAAGELIHTAQQLWSDELRLDIPNERVIRQLTQVQRTEHRVLALMVAAKYVWDHRLAWTPGLVDDAIAVVQETLSTSTIDLYDPDDGAQQVSIAEANEVQLARYMQPALDMKTRERDARRAAHHETIRNTPDVWRGTVADLVNELGTDAALKLKRYPDGRLVGIYDPEDNHE